MFYNLLVQDWWARLNSWNSTEVHEGWKAKVLLSPCLEVHQSICLEFTKGTLWHNQRHNILSLGFISGAQNISLVSRQKIGTCFSSKKNHTKAWGWLGVEGEMAAKEARACRTPDQRIIWNDRLLHTGICLFQNLELSVFTHSCLLVCLFYTLLFHTERSNLFHTQLLCISSVPNLASIPSAARTTLMSMRAMSTMVESSEMSSTGIMASASACRGR